MPQVKSRRAQQAPQSGDTEKSPPWQLSFRLGGSEGVSLWEHFTESTPVLKKIWVQIIEVSVYFGESPVTEELFSPEGIYFVYFFNTEIPKCTGLYAF